VKGAAGRGYTLFEEEIGEDGPVEAAASETRATTELVITIRRMKGYFRALLRMEIVPWIAGRMMVVSGSFVYINCQLPSLPPSQPSPLSKGTVRDLAAD